MQYLIRMVQAHEAFRKAELLALATIARVRLAIIYYDERDPFCVVDLDSDQDAKALVSRSILSSGIYELWASASDYTELHTSLRRDHHRFYDKYWDVSFRFTVDSFRAKRTTAEQLRLIESFNHLDFQGPIKMINPDLTLCIFENFGKDQPEPNRVYLGRWIGGTRRDAVVQFDLKKRRYISRTSMDAELSLVTANLTLAAPGKLIYDPFVGTGSFSVTAAHFGAVALGSDIDGRSVRGSPNRNLLSNFEQYGVTNNFLDSFIADITHTPLKQRQWLDGIVCDPPYGLREGPKVLGTREGKQIDAVMIDGIPAHT